MSDIPAIVIDCPSCKNAMDVTAMPPFTRVSCPSCGEKTRVKTEFGPYCLDRRLSTGGMSVLFVARDTLLDREVAVKILNEDYSNDERRIAAFEEEARVTAALSHPNIVRVLTTGRAFGRFYIAMELVPGGHFEHHIRTEGRIPEARMLKLAIQIASGLKAAHEANLIHRDIKPGNILLDADGNAKIVDFGLALVTQGGTARANEFWATPYYVPPETIEGAEEDFRSDIYAFGATLYHALAGKPPCNEESMSGDLLRNAKKQVVSLCKACPELSMAVCEIVDKAMAYHPRDRYASYDDLLNDLQDAANRTKHGHAHESAGKVARRRSRKRKARYAAFASIGLLGGFAIIGVWTWMSHRDAGPPAGPTEQTSIPDRSRELDAAGLAQRFDEARDSFFRRSYGTAMDRFAGLFSDPQVPEPTRTWAGVQAIVAAFLDEDTTRARQLSAEMISHLANVNPGDPQITPTLLPLLRQIEAGRSVAFEGDEPPLAGAPSLMAWLIVGVHKWQSGSHVKAAGYFTTARDIVLDGGAEWFAIHQDIARDHLADLALLDDPACHAEPADLDEAEEVLEQLMELRGSVRTRGPIGEILREKVIDIEATRKRFAEAAEQKNGSENGSEIELEPPVADRLDPFEFPLAIESTPEAKQYAVRDEVLKLIAEYDFQNALERMNDLNEREFSIQQRNAWMAVARGAKRFIAELEKDVAANAIPIDELRLKSGATLTGIRPHPGQTPADRDGNPIPWSAIDADSYIDWHRARVSKLPEAERMSAHESAIAFDLIAGDRNRAVHAIQRIGTINPHLERYWSFVLQNLPM